MFATNAFHCCLFSNIDLGWSLIPSIHKELLTFCCWRGCPKKFCQWLQLSILICFFFTHLLGVYIPEANHYYYPGFRQQTRFPARRKSVVSSFDELCEIEEEESITVKQTRAIESGYTGLSILHRLHPLYGFEYERHMVYDEPHGISLNAVKNHNALLKADDDEPVDWKEVDLQLRNVQWTHGNVFMWFYFQYFSMFFCTNVIQCTW